MRSLPPVPAPSKTWRPTPDPSARNYMYYRGRVLRFGKLTMVDADLQIVDGDPDDPFDFYLGRLNQQLVAGESRNQEDFGLVTVLPDYADLQPRRVSLRREKQTHHGSEEQEQVVLPGPAGEFCAWRCGSPLWLPPVGRCPALLRSHCSPDCSRKS